MHGRIFPAVVYEEPLGERLGPFIFWPVLVLLVGVIVWALLRKRTASKPGVGSGKSWTNPDDYREHHRVVWADDPAAFELAPKHWPLAVTAVFGICSGTPWDRVAVRNLDDAREGLQEAWGIRSRPQLLGKLYWILREGHRVEFSQEIEYASSQGDETVTRLLRDLAKEGSESAREQAWRLQQVRADARGIRETNFDAWDLVRAAMLVRAGYSLEWLTAEEASDTLNLLSAQLQDGYTSWQELGEHFMLARWYWGGNSGLSAQQEDAHDVSRQRALLDPQRGPWAYVPWGHRIAESGVLLAEALVFEGLVDETPADAPTPLAAIIDEAIAVQLDRRS